MNTIEQRLIRWLLSGDSGVSSRTIAAVLSGNYLPATASGDPFVYDIPRDPADLGRCLRLLALIPEWEPRLPEVAAVFPEWEPLVAVWGDLKAGFAEESPTGSCLLLYRRMRAIREGIDRRSER